MIASSIVSHSVCLSISIEENDSHQELCLCFMIVLSIVHSTHSFEPIAAYQLFSGAEIALIAMVLAASFCLARPA